MTRSATGRTSSRSGLRLPAHPPPAIDGYPGTPAARESTSSRIARRIGARTIVSDARDDEASLLYYWRDQAERVLAWPQKSVPDHQFDLTHALTDAAPLPILFVSRCGSSDRLARQFAQVEQLGTFDAPTGPTSGRTYFAFKLDGRRDPLRPLGGC